MNEVVLLDAGLLGLLCNPHNTSQTTACRQWAVELQNARRRLIVPEIADYEVRRELLRANLHSSVVLLDLLAEQLEYLPINTAAMRRAAEFWAVARQAGQPTADSKTIDADVILAGQATTFEGPEVLVATTNVGHLSRYTAAKTWHEIVP